MEHKKERDRGSVKKRVHRRWRAIAFNLESRSHTRPFFCQFDVISVVNALPGKCYSMRAPERTHGFCVRCNLLSRALYMNLPPVVVVSGYGRSEPQRCGPALAATFWMQFRSQIFAHPSERFVATLINLGTNAACKHPRMPSHSSPFLAKSQDLMINRQYRVMLNLIKLNLIASDIMFVIFFILYWIELLYYIIILYWIVEQNNFLEINIKFYIFIFMKVKNNIEVELH